MALIQLPVRWTDKKRLEKDEEILKRVIEGEDVQDEIQYTYGSVVMDVDDIRCYNDLDADHCILRTYYGDSYCIHLSFENLKQIMVEMTNRNITMVRRAAAEDVPVRKTKPRKDKPESDDDIII